VVLLIVAILVEIVHQVLNGASPAISRFGLPFVWHSRWAPTFDVYGAAALLYGTLITSAMALLLAAPVGIAIGLYLSMLAPRRLASLVGPLVEMLAAIPSVILGFWGLLVLAPFVQGHIEPALHSALGFIPLFGAPESTGASLFTAALILAIMVVPIVASLSRDLFLTVPGELKDGAAALGATPWEVIRGVVLPTTAPGVASAIVLGLGRALGEAIAVAQVVGGLTAIHTSVFKAGDTLAGRVAIQWSSAVSSLNVASLFYLGAVLLVISAATNLVAQLIGRRFAYQAAVAP
jgi:phosphate transport system permease protein